MCQVLPNLKASLFLNTCNKVLHCSLCLFISQIYIENCLDEHVKYHPDKVALIWERDDEKTERVTYK